MMTIPHLVSKSQAESTDSIRETKRHHVPEKRTNHILSVLQGFDAREKKGNQMKTPHLTLNDKSCFKTKIMGSTRKRRATAADKADLP